MAGINVFKDGNAIASSGASGFYQRVGGVWSPLGGGGGAVNAVLLTGNQVITGNKYFQGPVIFGPNNPSGARSQIAGGQGNTITTSGGYSFIGAGYLNVIYGQAAIIGGGIGNIANSEYSAILGGFNNNVLGQYSLLGGGNWNKVSGDGSSLVGGNFNNNYGNNSFLGGGYFNKIENEVDSFSCYYNVLVGGGANTNSGQYSFLGGGSTNSIGTGSSTVLVGGNSNAIFEGDYAIIVGGLQNSLSGTGSIIVGGQYNSIVGFQSVIVCTNDSIINSNYSFIGAGANFIDVGSDYSFIGGGTNQIQDGCASSAIVGGQGNRIETNADHAFIGGGNSNIVVGAGGVVCGGDDNLAAELSFVGGGTDSKASGQYCSVVGGDDNRIGVNGNYSVILGGGANRSYGTFGLMHGNGCITSGNYNVAIGNNARVASGHHGAWVIKDDRSSVVTSPRGRTLTADFQSGIFMNGVYMSGSGLYANTMERTGASTNAANEVVTVSQGDSRYGRSFFASGTANLTGTGDANATSHALSIDITETGIYKIEAQFRMRNQDTGNMSYSYAVRLTGATVDHSFQSMPHQGTVTSYGYGSVSNYWNGSISITASGTSANFGYGTVKYEAFGTWTSTGRTTFNIFGGRVPVTATEVRGYIRAVKCV